MKQQGKAVAYALLAVLCWSTIGSAFKISLRYLDFLHLLLFSSFFAMIVLFLAVLVQKKIPLLAAVRGKEVARSALMGLLNPFLYYVVLLKAYELLPAQEAGTLNYIWPLVLVLLSIPLLRQRISGWSILAILISFSGILIISTHGDITGLRFSNPLGVVLAVGSAVFWALFWILNIRDPREEVTKLFLNFVFGFAYTLILVLVVSDFHLPGWEGWAGSVYLGLFEMGITFILWLKALKLSSTTAKVSNLIYLSPFISLMFIHFVVGEMILLSTIVGLCFIIGGIILQQYLKA
jgi:drug/metabolite transporter (DMT)-like permease